jgi:hypothetical protein
MTKTTLSKCDFIKKDALLTEPKLWRQRELRVRKYASSEQQRPELLRLWEGKQRAIAAMGRYPRNY